MGDTTNYRLGEDVEYVKLGDICSFFSGGTPLTSNKNYYDGDIPFITSGEISDSITEKNISSEALENSSAKLVQQGDILYALYGATSGKTAIAKIKGAINQAILCIRPNEHIVDKYFLYSFLALNKDKIISKYLQGGQGNLSANQIKNIDFPIVSIDMQKKFSNLFILFDNQISNYTKQKELLEQKKKHYLNVIFNDKNGAIKYKIEELFDITRGNVIAKSRLKEIGYPVYSSQTNNDGIMGYTDGFLFENAITWTTDGANAGTVKYRKGKFYCSNVCGVLINNIGFSNIYVAEKLNTITKHYISYVGNPKLMNNVMGKIEISLVPLKKQREYSMLIQLLDDAINSYYKIIDNYNKFKKNYLFEIFNEKE